MSAVCLSLSAVCMEGKMQAQFLLCHLQYSMGGVVFLFGLVRGFLSPLETGSTSLLAQMARSRWVSPSLAQVLGEGWLLRPAGPWPDSPGPVSSALDSLRLS